MGPWALVLGTIGANLLSGVIGSNASKKAAEIQSDAANRAVDLQAGTLQQARIDAYPWALAGAQALYTYMDELGIPRPQTPILPDVNKGPLAGATEGITSGKADDSGYGPGGANYSGDYTLPPDIWSGGIDSPEDIPMTQSLGFRETPGYQYQVEQGEKAVIENMNALGLRGSGATLKALTRFRQGLADETYNNYLNRVSGIAGLGQTQTNQTNMLSGQLATGIGNTLQNAGAARASGYVGAANSWLGALGGASNNLAYLAGSGYLD